MRRFISLLSVAIAAAGLTILTISPARAFGSESLGCIISPSQATTVGSFCQTHIPSGSYDITYQLSNLSGTYSFAWSVPPGYPVISGCTSTAIDCVVSAFGGSEQTIQVSVVVTQGSSSETLSATAFITVFS
jgi:hypothetical protein